MSATNWSKAMQPLLKKYRGQPHPLEYKDLYQLLVMVVLSAQSTDKLINTIAPGLFKAFPDMRALSDADEEDLIPYITKVRNFRNKARWLTQIAKTLKENKKIPLSMEALTALPGIGRKSANVIQRGAGTKAEGIVVDLHVLRVAPRIGIASGTDAGKIEKQLMEALPQKDWGEAGMAISFLGREICRPTHPQHHECPVQQHCVYFKKNSGKALKPKISAGKRTEAFRIVKKTTSRKNNDLNQ